MTKLACGLAKTIVGARFPILIDPTVLSTAPRLSVTERRTMNVPLSAYSWVTEIPVAVCPSPQSQAWETIVASESTDPDARKWLGTHRPAVVMLVAKAA